MRDSEAAAYKSMVETRLQVWGGILLRLAFAAVTLYLLWRIKAVLSVVIVSLVVACATSALVDPLCRRRLHFMKPHTQRNLATLLVFVVLGFLLYFAGQLIAQPFRAEFIKLVKNWPLYNAQIQAQIALAKDAYATWPLEVRNLLGQQQDNFSVPSPSSFFSDFGKRTVTWASHAVEMALVPVLAFYFTADGRQLRKYFMFLVPRQRRRQTIAILDESNTIMRAYIISQFWLALIAGVLVFAGLRYIGMEYAVVLALFAAFTRAIPVIGPFLGGVPLVLLTFVYGAQIHNPYLWVWTTIAFGVMHIIETKLVMPQFLGRALNLHAVVVIIALLIGGEFFGLMGMFLAAPVAALIRVLLEHYVIRPDKIRTKPAAANAVSGNGRVLRLERALRAARALPTSLPASLSTTTVALPSGFSSEKAPPARD